VTSRRPAIPGVTITRSGAGRASGYLTATSARAFGTALRRQFTAGHARGPAGYRPKAGKPACRLPPVFSSPAAPGWNTGRFGFYPGLRTPQLPATHAEAETGHHALARVLHLRHQPNLQTVPPT
jgi:hypothetical protein